MFACGCNSWRFEIQSSSLSAYTGAAAEQELGGARERSGKERGREREREKFSKSFTMVLTDELADNSVSVCVRVCVIVQ